jgi:serine/threonine protein kinase
MQALEHLIGELIDGKYRIDRLLGKGGMGAVYLATHLGTDRPVALKVITPQFMRDDEFVARFQREARAAGRLRHPNVVNVTDFGFARVGAERVAYLVMEYLDGCTLAEILEEESHLPLNWVVDILEQACSAVDEAHQQGIIHRDLKPDNIWLEPNRRGGYTVKVLDFGLAKLADAALPGAAPEATATRSSSVPPVAPSREETPSLSAVTLNLPSPQAELTEATTQLQPSGGKAEASDEEERTLLLDQQTKKERAGVSTASIDGLTRVGSIMGTPLYMSPEQCRGEALDARSDVYSLGVIAYQMLTGETPFTGEMATVMKLHLEASPPPLREKRRDVPKKVAAVVMSALAKNPSERPAGAAAFASALHAYAERPGGLLRRAVALASEHFPLFMRLALIIFTPWIIVVMAQATVNTLAHYQSISKIAGQSLAVLLGVANAITTYLTNSVMIGITARLVTQLLAAPLRPVHLRPAFTALKQRLRSFVLTTLRANFKIILGMILLFIPGLIFMVYYHLVAPVVMIEGLKGKAALKRSKELVRRAKRIVVMVIFIQVAIPALTGGVLSFMASLLVNALKMKGGKDTVGRIVMVTNIPLHLLIAILTAILTALLYLTTRQAGGETLRETLGLFEEEELPDRRWQRRMRERLASSSSSRR